MTAAGCIVRSADLLMARKVEECWCTSLMRGSPLLKMKKEEDFSSVLLKLLITEYGKYKGKSRVQTGCKHISSQEECILSRNLIKTLC